MKKLFVKYGELFLVSVYALALAVINQYHVISQWFANKPDAVFTGIAHYFADYFMYVDVMAQGARGAIFTQTAHFTNEPVGTTWIYWLNALIGLIGKLFGLSPFGSYNTALFIFIICYIFLLYRLLSLIFPTSRLVRWTALIFITLGSYYFDINSYIKNGQVIEIGRFWFSPTPALNRLGGVPHQVFQNIIALGYILLWDKILSYPGRINVKRILLLTFSTFIIASSQPAASMELCLAIGVASIYVMVAKRRLIPPLIFQLILTAIISALGAIATSFAWKWPPFAVAAIWESLQYQITNPVELLYAIGPLIILVPFGIPGFFIHTTPVRIIFFVFGIISFILYLSPLPQIFHAANARFLNPAAFGIIGALSAEGAWIIGRVIQVILRKITRFPPVIVFIPIVVFQIILALPPFIAQVDNRSNPAKNIMLTSALNHVPQSVIDALKFLVNDPSGDFPVVVTDPMLQYDVLIPVFTGKISFTGHPLHTLYGSAKEALRWKLVTRQMTESEAGQFFANHRIGYLLTSSDRSDYTYPFLRKIYDAEGLVILKYNPNILKSN